MPKITRVYTRKGDDGTTSLGGGQRVDKDSLRIETYGTVDELNSFIGLAISTTTVDVNKTRLREIQNELFHLGCDLCILEEDKEKMPVPGIDQKHTDKLEKWMDEMNEELPALQNFILPGGTLAASYLHVARTVCRRGERHLAQLHREEPVGENTLQYMNRLSDLLFVMSRYENQKNNIEEPYWDSKA
ncbi:cob(I)yrinic acid a,c-diamide adenosyltransferase [Candidatus Uabimicrobium amorphum]|uniref:Corrinoid adenosyltransferase n=1 Tax=Uabimicrobium amorphum TaxID=2596890 RepID=A0A5S9IJF2_UABAM|nr:cob(I)yrinic acid a,c-diamide adenosyltransferase [Candidatus Uabimicrobium amorphum]BBM82968.1 cob(I)yrinic acid a,c-diamideadenosyltransferase [Candidatus Uabimicrobium amorphum]